MSRVQPRVSIGLPVYNGERYLEEALDSILEQDFEDFELIVSDNASSDGTEKICQTYAKRDSRLRYSRLAENIGAAPNYNRVFRLSSGPLFKWATHDDLIRPSFLSRCVEEFAARETPPTIVYPEAEFIDEHGDVIRLDSDHMRATSRFPFTRAFQTLQGMNMTSPIAGVFHSETLKRTRLVGSFIGSDYVLLLEAGLVGKIVQLEGEALFQRRIHRDMSRKANLSDEDVLRWFDPKARVRLSRSRKLHLEYLRAPMHVAHLSAAEKALCVAAIVGGVSFRRARVRAGKFRRRLVSRFSK